MRHVAAKKLEGRLSRAPKKPSAARYGDFGKPVAAPRAASRARDDASSLANLFAMTRYRANIEL